MESKREQFSLIYDQYIDKIYRFVYLKVDSQETAQDLTSKTFLKGWESYQKEGQEVKNPGAFLYQIARNLVTDHYRGQARTKIVSPENVAQLADSSIDILQKAALNADMDKVKLAIQRLKKDHQDVLIWYYLEDMPAEQIATLLGKPAGTVRVIIHRGLEALKNELRYQS